MAVARYIKDEKIRSSMSYSNQNSCKASIFAKRPRGDRFFYERMWRTLASILIPVEYMLSDIVHGHGQHDSTQVLVRRKRQMNASSL